MYHLRAPTATGSAQKSRSEAVAFASSGSHVALSQHLLSFLWLFDGRWINVVITIIRCNNKLRCRHLHLRNVIAYVSPSSAWSVCSLSRHHSRGSRHFRSRRYSLYATFSLVFFRLHIDFTSDKTSLLHAGFERKTFPGFMCASTEMKLSETA